jgi:anhydro-N-acetylmuramic acid kinase
MQANRPDAAADAADAVPAPTVRALGLMSGTSCDGIDAAIIETDGLRIARIGATLSQPYAPSVRNRLRAALGTLDPLPELERALTELHADAVMALLAKARLAPSDVRLIGFHGQTVLHAPERRLTRQIGDGALLARLTGIDVVNDFRSRDVAEGGEGAPFAPLFHWAMARALEKPLAVLNIGGVANVTWIGADSIGSDGPDGAASLLAFDTGPGNALIDDWAQRHTGRPVDVDGQLARAGRVDAGALAALMAHPYFAMPAPKSLDRNAFGAAPAEALSPADGAATLAAFTVAAVAAGARLLPAPARRRQVTRGGRHNPHLMASLAQALGAPVQPVEAVGWDGDMLEAQAFAFLAVRSLYGWFLSLPGTTAVPAPVTGGRLHRHLSPAAG